VVCYERIVFNISFQAIMTLESKTDKYKKFARKKDSEVEDFKSWLMSLGMTHSPKLHVNGVSHSMAVVTIDFGTPLEELTKMTSEQNAELMARLKNLTKSLHKNDVNVRVQNDTNNGIWWSTVN
jgi:hypothetical protein